MLNFLRHALMLTASVQGQLALLVRLQWIAGQRAAEVMSAAPFAAVVVLTRQILWFDRGEDTKPAQHHHAWVVFDHAHPSGRPPASCTPERCSGRLIRRRAPIISVPAHARSDVLRLLNEGSRDNSPRRDNRTYRAKLGTKMLEDPRHPGSRRLSRRRVRPG